MRDNVMHYGCLGLVTVPANRMKAQELGAG